MTRVGRVLAIIAVALAGWFAGAGPAHADGVSVRVTSGARLPFRDVIVSLPQAAVLTRRTCRSTRTVPASRTSGCSGHRSG